MPQSKIIGGLGDGTPTRNNDVTLMNASLFDNICIHALKTFTLA
jgi:hypothetical protein